jgi:6,7-dimethyl-8-ribityllumazine synthase
MPRELRARLDGSGRRVAIVASRFNDFVTRRLVDGAVECLTGHGVEDGAIDVYWVAGSFELPQLAARIARAGRADGIVCLGALIRGETIHFDVLASSVASALESLGVEGDVPVTFGVITADTMEQAVDRAGGKHGNVGWNAALSLVEMMSHWQQ